MANNATKISELNACTTPEANAVLAVVGNTASNNTTFKVEVDKLFSNAAANASFQVLTALTFVCTGNTPANSSDANGHVVNNSIWSDGDYVYVLSGGTVKRAALSTF